MAVASNSSIRVGGLRHLRLCSAQAQSLAAFYESALGCRKVAVEHLSGARMQERFGVTSRALRITLELGVQKIKLLQFVDQPGRNYPAHSASSDLVFQHFAIVVTDMDAAMEQLAQTAGWTPITRGGPQQLPASSGGVTAFKFRDPEGHPLELLAFPPDNTPKPWRHHEGRGLFLGIDHSAISVADSERSVAFYESLGFLLSRRTVNDDPVQAPLDNLVHPVVDVIAMQPGHTPPHVELLCYRKAGARACLDLRTNDVAATCLVFNAEKSSFRSDRCRGVVYDLLDPDGHRLAVVCPVS